MLSSLAATVIGLMCAAIGFCSRLPNLDTPLTPQLKAVGVSGLFGLTTIGFICNVFAMKYGKI